MPNPYNAALFGSGTLAYSASGKSGFGQEISLTGAVPAISLPVGAYESFGASGTLQCWVKTSTQGKTLAGYDAPNATIIVDATSTTTGALRFVLQLGNTTNRILNGVKNICDGAYHHVVCQYGPGSTSTTNTPTTSMYILVDGLLDASLLNIAGAYVNASGANNRNIGTASGNASVIWNGTIDDFALSSIMEYPVTGTYTVPTAPLTFHAGLIALYHFDSNLNDSNGGVLTIGTASQISNGDGVATLDAGTATGGSGSYTYQWYIHASDDDTNTTIVATTKTLALTGLTNGLPVHYVLQVSDGSSTVQGDFIWAVAQKPICLVFVGDSLTGGADGTPPAPETGTYLQGILGGGAKVLVQNFGLGGSRTSQWRSDSTTAYTQNTTAGVYDTVAAGSPSTMLNHALSAISAAITTYGAANVIVPVCLGTNDPNSGAPITDGNTTAANLTNILTALKATGAKIVLQDIPWRAAYGNTYNAARNSNFDSIVSALGGPAANVYRGDKGGVISYQQGHTEYYVGGNGPHDLQAYQVVRASIWAWAIAKSVFGIGVTSTVATTVTPLTLTVTPGVGVNNLAWLSDPLAANGYAVLWMPGSALPIVGATGEVVGRTVQGTLTWSDTSAYRLALAAGSRYEIISLH